MKTRRILMTISCATALFAISCTSTNKQQSEGTTVTEVNATQEVEATKLDFDKTLTWDKTNFLITVADNSLTIQPSGLEEVNDKVVHDVIGKSIVNAEIDDLNGDGFAEVLIYLSSHGSGSYGDVIAYSVNNGKSMSQVSYNVEGDSDEVKSGYMGHDKFSIVNKVLTREFPIYKDNDSNANPTGGTKIIKYKLVDGEASRKFVVDNIEIKE